MASAKDCKRPESEVVSAKVPWGEFDAGGFSHAQHNDNNKMYRYFMASKMKKVPQSGGLSHQAKHQIILPVQL